MSQFRHRKVSRNEFVNDDIAEAFQGRINEITNTVDSDSEMDFNDQNIYVGMRILK